MTLNWFRSAQSLINCVLELLRIVPNESFLAVVFLAKRTGHQLVYRLPVVTFDSSHDQR
jgi:hypothetical protein